MLEENGKILFILHFPPPVHGASMVGKFIKESLSINEAFDARFINLGTSASVDEIGKGGFKKLFRYFKIIKDVLFQLLSFKPGLCYLAIAAKGGAFYKDAFLALIIKSFGFRIVYHFHNKGVSANQEKKIDHFLYSLVFKNADVILLSKYLYKDIQKYVPENRVYYCANGIPDIQVEKKPLRKIASEKVEILFLSNLIESKGVFVLLQSCKILVDKNIKFHCIYVGGEGDVNTQDFNMKVRELGLENQVSYLGKKYGYEKKQVFENADIFAFPTYYHNETFGLVNLEAMQFSLPIVSTKEGGIPDVIDDGETGFLVDQKSVKALAKKLEILIKDPVLCYKMGKAGRKKYEEQFTLEIFENNLKSILTNCLK